MTGIVTHWDPAETAGFARRLIGFRHTLHERPMFSDEGLASILDRYPRQALGVFTMGEDLEDWRSWRRGSAGAMSGDQLLAAVQEGRLWLNLRHANEHLSEFAALCDEISAEKEKALRTRVLNRDLGLLISSPKARVFYHLDVPYSSLWQVRGEKRFWLYPRTEPYVQPAWLERCVQGTAEGQMPFSPAWDEVSAARTLTAGDMITWPQNAPHRVIDECLGVDGVHDPTGAGAGERVARQRPAAHPPGLDAGDPGPARSGHGRKADAGRRAQGGSVPQGPRAGAGGIVPGRGCRPRRQLTRRQAAPYLMAVARPGFRGGREDYHEV